MGFPEMASHPALGTMSLSIGQKLNSLPHICEALRMAGVGHLVNVDRASSVGSGSCWSYSRSLILDDLRTESSAKLDERQ